MDKVMSIDEFCELFRLSKSAYYRMRKQGEGPPMVKLDNGRVHYLCSEVEQWIEEHTVKPNPYLLLAQRKAAMLDALIRSTSGFDADEEINGADFVDWFAEWRRDVITATSELEAALESQ